MNFGGKKLKFYESLRVFTNRIVKVASYSFRSTYKKFSKLMAATELWEPGTVQYEVVWKCLGIPEKISGRAEFLKIVSQITLADYDQCLLAAKGFVVCDEMPMTLEDRVKCLIHFSIDKKYHKDLPDFLKFAN